MGGDGSRAPGVERVEAGREGSQPPPSPPVAPSPRGEASAAPRALGRAPGQRVNVPVPRRVAPGRAGRVSPLVALAGDGGLGEGTGGSARTRSHGPPRATRERRVGQVVVERARCGQLRWPGSPAPAPPLHIGAGRPAARFDSLSPAFHSGLA